MAPRLSIEMQGHESMSHLYLLNQRYICVFVQSLNYLTWCVSIGYELFTILFILFLAQTFELYKSQTLIYFKWLNLSRQFFFYCKDRHFFCFCSLHFNSIWLNKLPCHYISWCFLLNSCSLLQEVNPTHASCV